MAQFQQFNRKDWALWEKPFYDLGGFFSSVFQPCNFKKLGEGGFLLEKNFLLLFLNMGKIPGQTVWRFAHRNCWLLEMGRGFDFYRKGSRKKAKKLI